MLNTRSCTKCGSTSNGFHKNLLYPDGLHPHCKVCRKETVARRLANESSEKRQARLAKEAAYRNKPENKARQILIAKDCRTRKPGLYRETGRKADERRTEPKAKYNSQWRKDNKEVVAAYSRNRRAMVKNCEGSHTAEDVQWLLETQKYKCVVCCCDVKDKYHVDHITPLVSGGSNDKKNLQVLCPTCNNQKHAADPIDFMQRKGFLL